MNNRKQELRRQLRMEQKNISPEARNRQDRRLIQNLMGNDLYKNSRRVFLYASAGYEIHTHDLLRLAFEQGKTVALPRCSPGGVMDFYRYTGEMTEGMFHIPEPIGGEVMYPQPSDLLIVPGLAFDKFGYRIGQGGGYYDRYLAKYRCVCVGLCREQFLMEEIPTMWNDIPVDFVITENAVYQCKNGASNEAPLS